MTVVKSHSPLAAVPGLVFHGVSFDAKNRSTRSFDLTRLDAELEDEDVFSWVDIQAPDISPMNEVLRRMELDLTLVSHFDQPEVLPRIVERSAAWPSTSTRSTSPNATWTRGVGFRILSPPG